MNTFSNEIGDIYRLKVPFDNIYTSVFFIKTDDKNILVDCATFKEDVDTCILPALQVLGYGISDIDILVLTHRHGDHAGGLTQISALNPSIQVVTDLRELSAKVFTYPMAGHTNDSIGILDERSHTLISGDGLQGAGVDKYRCSLQNPQAYLKTVERVKNDVRIENILFSHAYEPWNNENAFRRPNVNLCLEKCIEYVNLSEKVK